MRHYYQRLYNVGPSPEIAKTRVLSPAAATAAARKKRPHSSQRSRSGGGGSRPSSSVPRSNAAKSFGGGGVRGQLNKGKSLSNFELCANGNHSSALRGRRDVRGGGGGGKKERSNKLDIEFDDNPGDYWTRRYVNDDTNHPSAHVFSSDDERISAVANNLTSVSAANSMRAPNASLRSSLGDLQAVNSINNMSSKIDRFLDVVERCEIELQKEYEFRKRRVEARLRPRWYRSMSSISNPATASDMSSRKTSFLSTQSCKEPVTKKKKSPNSGSAASRLYGMSKPQLMTTNMWTGKSGKSKVGMSRPSSSMAKLQADRQNNLSAPKVNHCASTMKPMKAFRRSQHKVIPEYPMPDTSKIQSRLKSDRSHYQPPRRKRLTKKSTRSKAKQSDPDEYDDDFEEAEADDDDDEEDNEEDENDDDMIMTRQWIDDQAMRGMARQRALYLSRYESHDKESSKDSAYGFSGGESRLATREPTPDTAMLQQAWMNGQFKSKRNLANRNDRQRLGKQSNVPGNMRYLNGHGKDMDSEDEKSSAYVSFVNRVTGDILQRGVYTEKALKDALESNLSNGENGKISKKEKDILLSKLRAELGIGSRSLSTSLSESNLKDLLMYPSRALASKGKRPLTAVSYQKSKFRDMAPCDTSAIELSDQEMFHLLHDIDLDESTVQELLRASRKNNFSQSNEASSRPKHGGPKVKEAPPETAADNLKIFDSLNISNLNISFNANAQAAKEKREQQRALLINSFAHRNGNSTAAAGTTPSDRRPRSATNRKSVTSSTGNRGRTAAAAAVAAAANRRPVSAGRQDSSSSNPDNVSIPVPKMRGSKVNTSSLPQTSVRQKKSAPEPRSQMPETPLHSSETPRSSSLYQPETDEDESSKRKVQEKVKVSVTLAESADEEIVNSDISEDEKYADEEYEEDVDDIAEEISSED